MLKRLVLIFVAVLVVGISLMFGSVSAAPQADGDLDPTFGGPPAGMGKVTTSFTSNSSDAAAVVVQPDGKLVVVGHARLNANGKAEIALARYLADGSLDTSFGNNGLVTTAPPSGSIYYSSDVALQSTGKIVVAGFLVNPSSTYDFFVARYNVDGTLDTSFGASGIAITDFNAVDRAYEMLVYSDDRILVVGDNGDFILARYTANGAPDTSFDGDGKVSTDFNETNDAGYSVILQSDGKIVAGGYAGSSLGLARYNTNGSLDTTFGGDGKVTATFPMGAGDARDLAIQADGKIVTVGQDDRGYNSDSDFGVMRFLPNGNLDTSFSGDGMQIVDFAANADIGEQIVLQPSGKILLAGYAQIGTSAKFALARLTSTGALDNTFGDGVVGTGRVVTDFGNFGSSIAGLAMQDGKIVVVGASDYLEGTAFALARYSSDGVLDPTFGDNEDLPGRVLTVFPGSQLPGPGTLSNVLVQSDGKIIGTGNVISSGTLIRYLPNGSIDTGFGTAGLVRSACSFGDAALQSDDKIVQLTGCGLQRFLANGAVDSSFVSANLGYIGGAIAIAPDGKIVVVGAQSDNSGGNGTTSDFMVRRFNADGTVDQSFDADGIVLTNYDNNDYATNVTVQPDGKIVVVGSSAEFSSDSNLVVLRYLPNGSLDSSFATAGIYADYQFQHEHETFNTVAVQTDGKIVVAGGVDGIDGPYSAVYRFTSSGAFDSSFDGDGVKNVDIVPGFSSEIASSLLLQPNGKILVAGNASTGSHSVFSLYRLLWNGDLDSTFGGDGIVTTYWGDSIDAFVGGAALQPDGKIVVGGSVHEFVPAINDTLVRFAVARYLNTVSGTPPTATATSVPATATSTSVPATATSTSVPVSPTPTTTPGGCIFSDVCSADYFYTPVQYLVAAGAVSGYSDNTFRPYNNTTRGQLSKIVVVAEGWAIDLSGAPHFGDVGTDNAFYGYIETAFNHGIISGYADGTFRWGNNVTRGQLSKIIVAAEGWAIDLTGAPHFSDVGTDNAFYGYIETAFNRGIISGYDVPGGREFRWGNNAIRAQIAKIVYAGITSTAAK